LLRTKSVLASAGSKKIFEVACTNGRRQRNPRRHRHLPGEQPGVVIGLPNAGQMANKARTRPGQTRTRYELRSISVRCRAGKRRR
jgi:hypothetical protein